MTFQHLKPNYPLSLMFQMANRDDIESSDGNPRVSAEYGKELHRWLRTLKRPGENQKRLLKRAKSSPASLSRLCSGAGTYKAAIQLRDFIAKNGGPELPDPFAPVSPDSDEEWVRLGRRMSATAPEEYSQLKRLLAKRLDAMDAFREVDSDMAYLFGKKPH